MVRNLALGSLEKTISSAQQSLQALLEASMFSMTIAGVPGGSVVWVRGQRHAVRDGILIPEPEPPKDKKHVPAEATTDALLAIEDAAKPVATGASSSRVDTQAQLDAAEDKKQALVGATIYEIMTVWKGEKPAWLPDDTSVDTGTWVPWLPKGWTQCIRRQNGRILKCFYSPDGARFWHKSAVEDYLGIRGGCRLGKSHRAACDRNWMLQRTDRGRAIVPRATDSGCCHGKITVVHAGSGNALDRLPRRVQPKLDASCENLHCRL